MNFIPGAIEEPAKIQAPPWTEAEDAILKRMWDAGKAASAVGLVLGRSRNAVIGRVHRLGMQKRGADWLRPVKPPKPAKEPVLKLKRVRIPPKPKPAVAPVFSGPEPLLIPLWELSENACHWPVNDGGPFLFCGHERNGHPTYCQFHQSKATTTHIFWGQR